MTQLVCKPKWISKPLKIVAFGPLPYIVAKPGKPMGGIFAQIFWAMIKGLRLKAKPDLQLAKSGGYDQLVKAVGDKG